MIKRYFDPLFDNAIHYNTYLSFANRPIPIKLVMFGMILHHYKKVVDLANNCTNKEFGIDQEIFTLEIYKPQNKKLFDKTSERWLGLINALHNDNREQFLKMVVVYCNGLSVGSAGLIIDKDSKSISVLFIFSLVLKNQKLLERIKDLVEKLNSG